MVQVGGSILGGGPGAGAAWAEGLGGHSSLRSTPSLGIFMILVALMWTQFPLGGGAHAEGGPALKLCCAWGRTLADADLTWSVAGADSATADVIRSGLREWDDVLASVSLTEVSPGTRKIDVVITFTEDPGRTEGQAVTSFTERGLIKKVEVGIQGARAPANTGGLLQITKHEFGHALGLGHANFDGNLMSEAVSPQPSPIEGCVMSAVIEANRWRLIDPQEKRPQRPIVDEVAC